jgi:hypothetical protein
MKEFNKPNLKAERFRPDIYNVLNSKFIKEFKKKYPKYKDIEASVLSSVIKKFNTVVYQEVIDTRDGIELPESIGWLFIGACKQPKKVNIDFAKSEKYGVTVTNKNWETDGKLAKIFFTNYAPKHRIKNREFWGFTACRNFKRTVAKVFPENWTNYVAIDPDQRIKQTYSKAVYKEMKEKETKRALQNYNEFDL